MDLVEFKEKYELANNKIDEKSYHDTIEKCIGIFAKDPDFKNYGRAYVISMEECAELSKEISKLLRGKSNRLSLIEEIADVEICIDLIKSQANISDEEINKAKNVKCDRLNARIEETGVCW